MKAAKNSEIESIGVSWGYHRPEVLKTETNNIAQNFDNILDILEKTFIDTSFSRDM